MTKNMNFYRHKAILWAITVAYCLIGMAGFSLHCLPHCSHCQSLEEAQAVQVESADRTLRAPCCCNCNGSRTACVAGSMDDDGPLKAQLVVRPGRAVVVWGSEELKSCELCKLLTLISLYAAFQPKSGVQDSIQWSSAACCFREWPDERIGCYLGRGPPALV